MQEIFHEAKPSEITCLISAICMSNSTVTVLFGINSMSNTIALKVLLISNSISSRLATFPRLRVAHLPILFYYLDEPGILR